MLEAAVTRRVDTEESAGLSGGAGANKRRAGKRSLRKGVSVDVCVFVPKGRRAWRRGSAVRRTGCLREEALEAC